MISPYKQLVFKQVDSNWKHAEGNSVGKHLFRVNNKNAKTRSIDSTLTGSNLVKIGDWQSDAEPFKNMFFWDTFLKCLNSET